MKSSVCTLQVPAAKVGSQLTTAKKSRSTSVIPAAEELFDSWEVVATRVAEEFPIWGSTCQTSAEGAERVKRMLPLLRTARFSTWVPLVANWKTLSTQTLGVSW